MRKPKAGRWLTLHHLPVPPHTCSQPSTRFITLERVAEGSIWQCWCLRRWRLIATLTTPLRGCISATWRCVERGEVVYDPTRYAG